MNRKFKYDITVFTPTYNRIQLLERAYESLKVQSFKDFEWLIIDDGSIDETGNIVQKWIQESSFAIRYIWQSNSGKPFAFNRGVKEAQGYFFIVLDSDDWFTPRTLDRFLYHWERIPDEMKSKFVGIEGLCAYPSGKIIGTQYPEYIMDSDNIEIRICYHVKGDKIGMHRTEIIREFPFPENLGKFIPESLVWNRIAQKYLTRYINELLEYKEYQQNGLSDNIDLIRAKNSKAGHFYYKEYINLRRSLPIDFAIRNYANFIRYSFHQKVSIYDQIMQFPSKVWGFLSFPIGLVLYLKDLILILNDR